MGVPLWILGGGAAVLGLILGYWWGEAEREELRKTVTDREKEALEDNERVMAAKAREVEEKAHELTEQLRIVQEREAATHKKQVSVRKKGPKKAAKGTEAKRDES